VRLHPKPKALPEFRHWKVDVRFKNEGDREIVLYPYFNIEVFDRVSVKTTIFICE